MLEKQWKSEDPAGTSLLLMGNGRVIRENRACLQNSRQYSRGLLLSLSYKKEQTRGCDSLLLEPAQFSQYSEYVTRGSVPIIAGFLSSPSRRVHHPVPYP